MNEIEHGRCGELLSVCSGDDVMRERDIARDAAEHWQGVAIAADEQLAGVVEERDRLRAENERLRALIGRAPHARHCEAGASLFPGSCSCWKKDAPSVPELVERSRALGPVMEAQGEQVARGLRDVADRMRGGE